jgi:hypothetical protein
LARSASEGETRALPETGQGMRETPTVTRLKVCLTAVAMALVAQAGYTAPAVSLPQAVEFYVADMEPAYEDLYTSLLLYHFCSERFPQECPLKQEHLAGLEDSVRKLKSVSLFGPPLAAAHFGQSYNTVEQTALASRDLQTSLLRNTQEYEKRLLTRYFAVNRACGGSAVEAESVKVLIAVDLQRFWGYDRAGYRDAVERIDQEANVYWEEIRALWSPERCARTRELGHEMMILLYMNLKDYRHAGWEKFVRRDKVGQAAEFVAGVALLLERKVHPDAPEPAGSP